MACIFFLRDSLQFEFPNKHIMSALTSYYPFYPFPNARFGINPGQYPNAQGRWEVE
jgi:hypothetical protein